MGLSMLAFLQLVPVRVNRFNTNKCKSTIIIIIPLYSKDNEDECTMFLIAGYARYNRPYVWIRTNHERIVQFSGQDSSERDYPLKLRTTSSWVEKG